MYVYFLYFFKPSVFESIWFRQADSPHEYILPPSQDIQFGGHGKIVSRYWTGKFFLHLLISNNFCNILYFRVGHVFLSSHGISNVYLYSNGVIQVQVKNFTHVQIL